MSYRTYILSFLFILVTVITQAQKDPFASTYKTEAVEVKAEVATKTQVVVKEDVAEEVEEEEVDVVEETVEKKQMIKYLKFDAFLQAKLDFSVPIISVEEFKALRESKAPIVLLDTRSEVAYNVSHIPSSKRVGYDDFSIERVWTIPRDAKIVVYCTLGYKSEQVGKFLTEMGFKNVQNLYGSIIEWVNEGGVVVNENNKRTKKVVVKDKERRNFLKKGHAIILSESEVSSF